MRLSGFGAAEAFARRPQDPEHHEPGRRIRFAFRLGHLGSNDAELLHITRGKLFLPSLQMWGLLLSERDMLIIALSS